ncbi:MAG: hypothetical protein Q8K97_14000 [Pseudohongiella sp.]|nr:hypothetical protein [Pseudohongiella sp.]
MVFPLYWHSDDDGMWVIRGRLTPLVDGNPNGMQASDQNNGKKNVSAETFSHLQQPPGWQEKTPDTFPQKRADAHHCSIEHGPFLPPENLVLLCRRHHRLVHEQGYEVINHKAGPQRGQIEFRRPDSEVFPRRCIPNSRSIRQKKKTWPSNANSNARV